MMDDDKRLIEIGNRIVKDYKEGKTPRDPTTIGQRAKEKSGGSLIL